MSPHPVTVLQFRVQLTQIERVPGQSYLSTGAMETGNWLAEIRETHSMRRGPCAIGAWREICTHGGSAHTPAHVESEDDVSCPALSLFILVSWQNLSSRLKLAYTAGSLRNPWASATHNTGVTGVCGHAWICMWALGIYFVQQVFLPTEPSPQHCANFDTTKEN